MMWRAFSISPVLTAAAAAMSEPTFLLLPPGVGPAPADAGVPGAKPRNAAGVAGESMVSDRI